VRRLVDAGVWIDHLRRGNAEIVRLLNDGLVLVHPFVVGELALGSLRNRDDVLRSLRALDAALVATPEEVERLVEARRFWGRGVGYVDAALLASAMITPDCALTTDDRRLFEVAAELGVAARDAAT